VSVPHYLEKVFGGLEPRLALALYLFSLIAAAAPIVFGWIALLPVEREPFAAPGEARSKKPRDAFAIFLLANISVSVLLRMPGIDVAALTSRVTQWVQADGIERVFMIVLIWFGFVPGLAAAYSAVRANAIRLPLAIGGVATLVLWLVGPLLMKAIAAAR
jgi:hypothetical protein